MSDMQRLLPTASALLGVTLLLHGCPGDVPPGDDDATDGDDDTTAGDDDDTTEPCEPSVEWGFGGEFTVGEAVGNWALAGYVDSDGDGQVEEVEVDFNLEDVHCAGHRTLVLVAGDST